MQVPYDQDASEPKFSHQCAMRATQKIPKWQFKSNESERKRERGEGSRNERQEEGNEKQEEVT